MKIAMVSEHASPLATLGGVDAGGQNVHVAELSAALARCDHEVTVYTRRDDPDLPERVTTAEGYTVVHVPAGPARPLPKDELLGHMGPFAQYLDEQWSSDRPDVTHAHFWMSGIATQLAARHLDLPAVQTFHALGVVKRRHQGALDTSPKDRLKLEAMVARTATWVAATCTDEVFELMRLGRSRTRISVVPCGVDLDLFTPDGPRAERGARYRVVSVGRFVPRKGFDVVVRALPAIADAELVLVGGPDRAEVEADPEARRLRELAERLGVGDRLVFQGAVARADMPALLRSADVVACTPWYEPFGIVPLEAMGCGVPVVAAAVGGMLDTVVHDVTGRLVTPKRPVEVAEAVNTLLHDAFLRQSLGAAGRDRARARYSWDRVAADTLRIYDRVVPGAHETAACDPTTSATTSASSV
ncbi:glycosyltransferase [Mycolicibacterium baixiangningiae]|uniref:glycosyltransferase n=1 Tax=Mycolicibacterium baixiangningiae TaxID=2761578 RepID=UPI0018D1ED33|nr:glycosyltransferase [Mycolicibacterium baixiangningiae]